MYERLNETTLQFLKASTIQSGSPNFLVELVDRFEQNSISLLSLINQAISEKDFESVKKHAHSLKGSAGMIGAQIESDYAKKLEEQAKSLNSFGCLEVFNQLKLENDAVLDILKTKWYH